jgi:hypothetical protein
MAKRYYIVPTTGGFDIAIVGPGVSVALPPEAKKTLKEWGVLKMLNDAYKAGKAKEALRGPRGEFEEKLLRKTREVVEDFADTELAYAHTVSLIGDQGVKMDDGTWQQVSVAVIAVKHGINAFEVIVQGIRERELIAALLREVEAPPQIVNRSRLLQLLHQYLPELAAASLPDAACNRAIVDPDSATPTTGDGAHAEGL